MHERMRAPYRQSFFVAVLEWVHELLWGTERRYESDVTQKICRDGIRAVDGRRKVRGISWETDNSRGIGEQCSSTVELCSDTNIFICFTLLVNFPMPEFSPTIDENVKTGWYNIIVSLYCGLRCREITYGAGCMGLGLVCSGWMSQSHDPID